MASDDNPLGGQRAPEPPDGDIRHQLATLARRPKARLTEFTKEAPTEWRPMTVENPDTGLPFTDASAWELIAERLEAGQLLGTVELRKPPGKLGYTMLFRLTPESPQIYVKLQLGSGKLLGRSFHYSTRESR